MSASNGFLFYFINGNTLTDILIRFLQIAYNIHISFKMDQKVTLGYWGFRGRGQIPRLLLAYTGAVWEDLKYTDGAQWFGADK